jgi:hypothetical protein
MVTFLEQFRIQYTPMYDLTQIQNYLKHQFTVIRDGSASELDPEW